MDLHDLIEAEPTPLRIDDHLAAGRRAVRRRRAPAVLGAGVGVGLAATAVVLLGAAAPWAAQDVSASTQVAAAPADPEPDASPRTLVAEYELDGTLVIADGWQVTERIEQPYTTPRQVDGETRAVPDDSVGLELTDGTRTEWVLAWVSDRAGGAAGATSEPADIGPSSLQNWVDLQVALSTRGATTVAVGIDESGAMVGRNGVEVLDQRATPELDAPGRTTAVADVTFPADPPVDGWVLLVRSGGATRAYPIHDYPVVDLDGVSNGPDTIDGFVEWAAPRLDAGRYR